jgi:hypothetical protein
MLELWQAVPSDGREAIAVTCHVWHIPATKPPPLLRAVLVYGIGFFSPWAAPTCLPYCLGLSAQARYVGV